MSRRANRGRVGRPVTASLRHDRDLTVGSVFPTRVALARGRCSVGVVACLLALFAVLFSIVRRGASRELDLRATVALQRRQQPWFRRLMETVSWPGFPPQSRLIPPLLALLWLLLGYPLEAVFQFAGWGTGLISFLVKRTMRRPRPTPDLVQVEAANIGGSSFPSGHVINYIGIYGTLAYRHCRRIGTGDWNSERLVGRNCWHLVRHIVLSPTRHWLAGNGAIEEVSPFGRIYSSQHPLQWGHC